MTVMPIKALALAGVLGIAVAGCAQTGGGTSSDNRGPYGSTPPGSVTNTDPSLELACKNVPAIEHDACIARAKERRSSPVRAP